MEADYVVVGAGPAGSVVASALAAPGRTVVLIEEGERREHLYARVPAAALVVPVRRAGIHTINSEADPTAAGRRLRWATPRGLCAGRSLDSLVYASGFARDYDEWAALGATGWSFADVAPVFARLEGAGSEALSLGTADHALARAFIEACAANGIPARDAEDRSDAPGAAAARLTLEAGRRESPADRWLRPRLRDRQLSLLTRTRVLALQMAGRRCIGVFARRDGQDLQVRARAEVILAAGVFGSPKLLMVSGIGPPGLLESVGVLPRIALAGVGGNLSDHVGIRIAAHTRLAGLCRRDRFPPLALAHYLRWHATGHGKFAVPAVLASAWAATGGTTEPDLALDLTPAALLAGAGGMTLSATPGLTITAHGRRPRSRGRLRPSGAGVDDPLKVEHLMLSDPSEIRVLSDGVLLARRLLATPALGAFLGEKLDRGQQLASATELAELIRERARPLGHAVGTCRMGPADDPDAVVDAKLRVHGMQGLRVIDASVMPRVPSGSPGAAAIMVAARAAEFIREDT